MKFCPFFCWVALAAAAPAVAGEGGSSGAWSDNEIEKIVGQFPSEIQGLCNSNGTQRLQEKESLMKNIEFRRAYFACDGAELSSSNESPVDFLIIGMSNIQDSSDTAKYLANIHVRTALTVPFAGAVAKTGEFKAKNGAIFSAYVYRGFKAKSKYTGESITSGVELISGDYTVNAVSTVTDFKKYPTGIDPADILNAVSKYGFMDLVPVQPLQDVE